MSGSKTGGPERDEGQCLKNILAEIQKYSRVLEICLDKHLFKSGKEGKVSN